MVKTVKIKDANCRITELYERVQRALGVEGEPHFNCTKIRVAKNIADAVFDFYKNEGEDCTTVAMWWLCYGPKTDESLEDDRVVVEEGFFE